MKIVLSSLFLMLLIASCGVSKNGGKQRTTQFSASEYPYIEKFHEGVRLKTQGQIDEAISLFEQCLQIKTTDDAVYYALSELYLMKGNREKSAENIILAAKYDPQNIWYVQELAYMYFEKGKFDLAANEFEKLVKHESQNVDWLYGYAECLVKVGKTTDAIKMLDKTEDQVGIHPELTLQKFNLYLSLKQVDKGITEIESARKQFPNDPQLLAALIDYYLQHNQAEKATSMLEELVRVTPQNGRAHLALADIYRQQGNQSKAYGQLKEAFQCTDVDIDSKMKILINIHSSGQKIDPEVYELIDILVVQYPTDAKSYSIKGDFLLRSNKEAEALKAFKTALQYDKNQFPIWNQVLIMEYQAMDFNALYQDSKVCLEYFPSIPKVYLFNGLSAVQLKNYAEAVSTLEIGKDLVVNDKEIESDMYGQLGEAYFGLSNFESGKASYEKALKLNPNAPFLMNNYAFRLATTKQDLNRALELMDAVTKTNDGIADFMDTKGFVLFQLGRYTDAQVWIEKAYEIKPFDKITVEHLGDVYFKLNNKEKALDFWLKAKTLGASSPTLDKKIEKGEFYEPIK